MIARTRERGMISSLITNGYQLSPERIAALNDARPRLPADQHRQRGAGRRLAQEPAPAGAQAEVAGRTRAVRREHQLRGGRGRAEPGGRAGRRASRPRAGLHQLGRHPARRAAASCSRSAAREMAVYDGLKRFGSRGDTRVNATFQDNLAAGRPNKWSCRAGSRYLYVDEDGLVSYCSQMRGSPGVPLEYYGRADVRARVRHAEDLRAVLHRELRPARRAASTTGASPQRSRRRRAASRTAPAGRSDEALARGERVLAGRRALVTGASSGIGEAYARAPARARLPAGPGGATRGAPARAGGASWAARCEVIRADLASRRPATRVRGGASRAAWPSTCS